VTSGVTGRTAHDDRRRRRATIADICRGTLEVDCIAKPFQFEAILLPWASYGPRYAYASIPKG